MSMFVKDTVFEADVFLPFHLYDGGPGLLTDPELTSEKSVPFSTSNFSPDNSSFGPLYDIYVTMGTVGPPKRVVLHS